MPDSASVTPVIVPTPAAQSTVREVSGSESPSTRSVAPPLTETDVAFPRAFTAFPLAADATAKPLSLRGE